MGGRVLIIGVGNLGRRFAAGLAVTGDVDELVLAGLSQGQGPAIAGIIASSYEVRARFVELDGTRQADVEHLLREVRPDLVIQSAALIGPWPIYARTDRNAAAIKAVGVGVQIPAQLPVLRTLMDAVKSVGFEGPVANVANLHGEPCSRSRRDRLLHRADGKIPHPLRIHHASP